MKELRVAMPEGHDLFVRDEGQGPAVLLLHGFTGSGRSLEDLSDRLTGLRRVRVDLLGHGHSDCPPEGPLWSMEQAVADLACVLQTLGIPRTHVIGYSMGARIGLALSLLRPDLVDRCVWIGARAGIEEEDERAARVKADEALAERIEREGVEAFVDFWMGLPLFASQQRLGAEALRAAREARLRNVPEALARSLRGVGAGAQPALFDRLPALRAPTLFVAGDEDPRFVAAGRDLAARAPDGRFVSVPDAGHAVHLEAPAAFASLAAEFLAGDGDASPGATS